MNAVRWGLLIAAVVLLAGRAAAQKPAAAADKSELQVYPLKFTGAIAVATTLQQLLVGKGDAAAEVRILAEPRTNSVIVSGGATVQTMVRELLKRIDEDRGGGEDARTVEVIPLGGLNADQDLEKALRLVFDGRSASFAVDRQRKLLLYSGDRQTRETATSVLRKLTDAQRAAQPTEAELRVRVVWLVSGWKRENAPLPPPDLGDVLDELGRLHVRDLSMAAQLLVNVPVGSPFQVEGLARLDTPCRLRATGTLTERKGGYALEIEMSATRETEAPAGGGAPVTAASRRSSSLSSLKTQITTPLGHAVVVGMTPTEAMTSVFVVQVLGKATKEEPRRRP